MENLITHKKINNYNLFNINKNVIIEKALFVSETKIEIYLKESIDSFQLHFYYYNYFPANNNKTKHSAKFDKVKIQTPKFKIFDNKIVLKGKFDVSRNYIVELNKETCNVIFDPTVGGILDKLFSVKNKEKLGLTYNEEKITFKIWSPPAGKVELILFDKNLKPIETDENILLKRKKYGIWSIVIGLNNHEQNSLNGSYFQYKISAYGEEKTALDPYAKSMAVFNPRSGDIIGKAAIINLPENKLTEKNEINIPAKKLINSLTSTLPERNWRSPEYWESIYNKMDIYSNHKHTANETDIIVYEANIRDFTIEPNTVNSAIAGTFMGFLKKIDYLKELGITHVQFMPVNKCYTLNEEERKYTDKTAKKSNYNWGYDPMNYFTPEGRYSSNPYNPYVRIMELKKLIKVLHENGIGVILDVVFNHTYAADTFENVAPGCYYRYDNNFSISGHTGAGASLESRHKTIRKLILDVLKHYVLEYRVDGFRFDLMNFLDKETVLSIRNEIGKLYNSKNKNELILLGEAWQFTDIENEAFTKINFKINKEKLNVGLFNDAFRDACAGGNDYPGFIQGNKYETSRIASGIAGGLSGYDYHEVPFSKDIFYNSYNLFAENPGDCLNYFSIHDGLTIWDKINHKVKDESKLKRIKMMKLAAAILFSSQGKIIIHGGDEILRTKPLSDHDTSSHRALSSDKTDKEEGTFYFHENSYSSSDYTNMFRWSRLTNENKEFSNDILEYYKGLIKMRRSIPALRYSKAENVFKGLKFLTNNNTNTEHNNELLKINTFNNTLLNKLIIKFINGPAYQEFFLTGEIHKYDANPADNKYIVQFNSEGKAKIEFSRKQINSFDLKKWNLSPYLNFKLVKTPGNWDYIKYAYSETGNNSIFAGKINSKYEVVIDLSIRNFSLLNDYQDYNSGYIAYTLDNTLENDLSVKIPKREIKKLLVIHNSNDTELHFNTNIITNPINWDIILDEKNSGIQQIKKGNSVVKVYKEKIIVPAISSTILAYIER